MIYRTMFYRVFFVVLVTLSLIGPLSAQTDPIKNLPIDEVDTRNFEIVLERSTEYRRPTAKEVGVLVERLCAQLDKIFSRYAPHRVADEMEQLKKAEAEGRKPTKVVSREIDEEDPNRMIPKCRIFIFNDRRPYVAKCLFDGIEAPGEGYAGFFTTKSNSIYMVRSPSLQTTRETILHETTHYYTFNFLPGGWRCYPEWFHEGLAMSYEKHIWNGDKLTVGAVPRVQPFDAPASAVTGLVRFRKYSQEQAEKAGEDWAVITAGKPKRGSQPETLVDPTKIQPFLETMFTSEQFAKEGILLKHPNEFLAHRYAMYQAFGRFLLFARPEHLGDILRQIALWEKDEDKKFPRQTWFVEAWKIAAEKKPVTVEEVGRWMQKNQLPFKWSFGDWQDQGDQIAGKAEPGLISILALSNPKALPKFTVYPKADLSGAVKFQAGVVINFIDNENFGTVLVDEGGRVLQMEKIRGNWANAKQIGKTTSTPNRGGPYPNGPAFQFAVTTQGNAMVVHVNKTPAGTYPRHPDGCCGFFISSTEGIFTY